MNTTLSFMHAKQYSVAMKGGKGHMPPIPVRLGHRKENLGDEGEGHVGSNIAVGPENSQTVVTGYVFWVENVPEMCHQVAGHSWSQVSARFPFTLLFLPSFPSLSLFPLLNARCGRLPNPARWSWKAHSAGSATLSRARKHFGRTMS